MSIDWIRLYQDEDDETHTMACSPPNYPTAEFIEGHKERYADWKPYVGPVKTWIPGMVTDAVKSGENKVNHFHKVIQLHFNIFLFPLFLVWLSIGINRRERFSLLHSVIGSLSLSMVAFYARVRPCFLYGYSDRLWYRDGVFDFSSNN